MLLTAQGEAFFATRPAQAIATRIITALARSSYEPNHIIAAEF
jgi:hypothetical protein